MEIQRAVDYAKALSGISYKEWEILKSALDRLFLAQKRELENEIQFSDVELARRIIRSQFG